MIDHNDPRLIDYALGEMTPDEAKAFEAELNLPENADALKAMKEFQLVAGAAKDALAEEPAGQLRAEQREAVVEQAAAQNATPITNAPKSRVSRTLTVALALAACLVVTFAVVMPNLLRSRSAGWIETAQVSEELKIERRMQEAAQRVSAPAPNGNVSVYTDPSAVGGAVPDRLEETESRRDRQMADRLDAVDVRESVAHDSDAGALQDTEWDDWDESSVSTLSQQTSIGGERHTAPRVQRPVAAPPPPPPAMMQATPERDELRSLGPVMVAERPAESTVASDVTAIPAPEVKRGPAASPSAVEMEPLVVEYPEPFFGGTPLDYWGPNLEAPDYRDPWTPRTPGAEKYLPIVENAFLNVLNTPLSTFSIDVDTGAYSNVRRFLQQGQLPPPDAVRIEEMINYFQYDLAQPTGEAPFSVTIEMADCPWAKGHKLARVALQGRIIDCEDRGPANLVFLIDVSGSMSNANKLPLAKEAMKALLNELQPHDRVAIVTYAGRAAVNLPSTSCTDKATIRAAIDALQASGATHGSQGIQQAYRIARENFIPGGINRVLLATDGDFNVGTTSHDALMDMIAREAKSNVFLTVLGFGYGNLKDATLEQIANKGNGNYAYIDTFAEARRVLVDQISGTLITIAKDVKIQVEFNTQHVQAYRLIGYENRALADRDFNDDTKDAGEIGAGHQVTALYQIVPAGMQTDPAVDPLRYQPAPQPETTMPVNPEWMTIKLRFKEPEGDRSSLIELPWSSTGGDLRQATPDMRFASSVAAFGMLLRNSQHRGSADFDLIMALAEAGKKDIPERQAFIDLVVTAKTLTNSRR